LRDIERTTKFKKDFKREMRSDARVSNLLVAALELLVTDAALPERLRDHALSGDWDNCRDCHLKPDLVLIYEKVDDDLLRLVCSGSHSELFG
jgi:mRNA interferase YafQ